MKTCKGCPTPAKCKAAGKCLKSAKMYGGGMAKKKGYKDGGLTIVLGMPVDTGAGLPANIQAMIDRGEYKKAAEAMKKLQEKQPKKESIKQKMKRGGGFNKGGYAKCGASNPPSKKR